MLFNSSFFFFLTADSHHFYQGARLQEEGSSELLGSGFRRGKPRKWREFWWS